MRICFLVGSMAISGGTYVIVQHAAWLRDHGYEVTLAVQEPFTSDTLAWHPEAPKLRSIPFEDAKQEPFDLVVATWWKTALELHLFNASRSAYFVQSIESRFYPEAEKPLRKLVDCTYRLPVSFVTEATWIKRHLETHFGHDAELVRNGIRKDIYRSDGPAEAARDPNMPRVLVEGHFGVSFKNTALSIQLARQAGAKDIWLLTGSPVKWIPGVNRVFSRIPMMKTPEIYRSCDVIIKLSTVEGMFGPPLEMFHCGGTSIVFDVTGHDEYIRDGVNSKVIPTGETEAVVAALKNLLSNQEELNHLKQGARDTADGWWSWEQSSAAFEQWVEQALQAPPMDKSLVSNEINGFWETYRIEEQERLANNPAIIRRHKLSAVATRFPATIIGVVKQVEAIAEVWLGKRKVC